MASAAAFYAAMVAWLSYKGLVNYKLTGVMELHKPAGMRHYSASLIADRPPDSAIEEPEVFEKIFRDGHPKGYILVDIGTGQFYSNFSLPKPNWRIQLTYLSTDYYNNTADDFKMEQPPILRHYSRRFYTRPYVEIGPGAFKFETVSYPPNFLQMNLKKLIKLKERQQSNTEE